MSLKTFSALPASERKKDGRTGEGMKAEDKGRKDTPQLYSKNNSSSKSVSIDDFSKFLLIYFLKQTKKTDATHFYVAAKDYN